jgi:hypothetical protein
VSNTKYNWTIQFGLSALLLLPVCSRVLVEHGSFAGRPEHRRPTEVAFKLNVPQDLELFNSVSSEHAFPPRYSTCPCEFINAPSLPNVPPEVVHLSCCLRKPDSREHTRSKPKITCPNVVSAPNTNVRNESEDPDTSTSAEQSTPPS